MGNKILRQRLRGPSLAAWYPRKIVDIKDVQREFAPYDLIVDNPKEDDRLDHIAGFVPPLDIMKGPRPNSLQVAIPREGRTEEAESSSRSHEYVETPFPPPTPQRRRLTWNRKEEEIEGGVAVYYYCIKASPEYTQVCLMIPQTVKIL